MEFRKINNITGWVVFGIAAIIYTLTVERTASYWDCGEFIAVSYKLMVPHPPGAPLFLLIGRMFSFLAMGDVTQVAYWINMISVLSSAFSILFLFWTITLLGRKLLSVTEKTVDENQKWILIAAGFIGAMACTFSDSYWFSAVEAEVYGMSAFFTAFVIWAVLKWELIEDESRSNRWLILTAYMVGLSIGVHLLNLVTIPALAFIYYFKKFTKVTRWGIIGTLGVSGIIILVIMVGIIPGLPSVAGGFELFFINSLGMPFGSGLIIFVLLLITGLAYSIHYSQSRGKVLMNTILLSLTFVLIGYSSYSLVLIRSNFDPPIDENNPENIMSFVSYLKREQYGNRPLFHGQYFDARLTDQKQGAPVYTPGEEKYEVIDHKIEQVYDPNRTTIFPRAYSSEPNHIREYRRIMNLGSGEVPTFADNIEFMIKHQMGHMYWRYFMWNFSGRESDIQDAGWLSPIDAMSDVPPSIAQNRGRNNYLMLPLLLGFVGLLFQYRKDPKSFSVVILLFILTGLALTVYLNSPPVEPRERDYIYPGSFYAFSIWIGLGVISLYAVFANFISNRKTAIAAVFLVSLSVPIIMLQQNWDDHNRSDRYFSVDSAKNFLASCAYNAILFTGGDNDTFPLWYSQDVEGFRTDTRVVVLSYFNTDWYIEQMTRQMYESEPFPFSLSEKDYRQGSPNDFVYYVENPNVKGAIDLEQYISLIKQNHPALRVSASVSFYNTVPSRILSLKVDKEAVLKMGIIPKGMEDLIVDRMQIEVKGQGLEKKDLMILDLIATNKWERPIYLNNTSKASIKIDLSPYLIQEGNAYRLLPIENPNPGADFVNTEIMYDNLMNKFFYRELDNPNTYYNEDYRSFVLNHRSSFNTLAEALVNEGNEQRAREVIFKSLELMPDAAIPYDFSFATTVDLLFQIGEEEKALEIAEVIATRADEALTYYIDNFISRGMEIQKNLLILNQLGRILSRYGEEELAKTFSDSYQSHARRLQGMGEIFR
jgi:MFS family permease